MLKRCKLIAILFLIVFSFSATAFSGPDNIYGFYSGLADILEDNIDNPDYCVSTADAFIQKHLPALAQNVQKNIQTAQNIDYENMSAEEAQQMAAQVEQTMGMEQSALMSEGMNEMNRFTNALTAFAMKHPEHAEKIGESLEKVSEELGFY